MLSAEKFYEEGKIFNEVEAIVVKLLAMFVREGASDQVG